jgi:hypothetical protein
LNERHGGGLHAAGRAREMLLPIQAAMGWTDSHLFEIAPGMWDGAGPIPTGGRAGPLDARKARLGRRALKISAPRRRVTSTTFYSPDRRPSITRDAIGRVGLKQHLEAAQDCGLDLV